MATGFYFLEAASEEVARPRPCGWNDCHHVALSSCLFLMPPEKQSLATLPLSPFYHNAPMTESIPALPLGFPAVHLCQWSLKSQAECHSPGRPQAQLEYDSALVEGK